jgi:two-component system chemotaxis response regulator CheY
MNPVLLVEDDDTIRELVAEFFKDHEFGLETAGNGAEALAKLHAGIRPCLILLDSQMPVMSGPEFMRQLLELPGHRHIPVYLFSAGDVRSEAQALGCTGYLKKPIDLDKLLAIARTCK